MREFADGRHRPELALELPHPQGPTTLHEMEYRGTLRAFHRVEYLAALVLALTASSSAVAVRTPVLVELFTSEGCSSCPPADRLLAKLAAEQPVDGALVVAVSLHVDYWNRLGWADPFSSPAYSDRQAGYARSFGKRGSYTPQMVVDGDVEFVGSDEGAARRAIENAARALSARAFVRAEAGATPGTLRVIVAGVAVKRGETADVLLAITEDGLVSSVTRGENAGSRLSHTAVARDLRVVGSVDASGRFDATVPVPKGIGVRHAFAFVQERGSRRVRGLSVPVALSPAK